MPCAFTQERLDACAAFHGHVCPGLTIGVRAAELALREFDNPKDYEMTAVVETDMCGVDAIQFLTGCTMGKGNLIHRDYGKMAFSFFDRRTGRGFRALLRPETRAGMDVEMGELMAKADAGTASPEDRARLGELREALRRRFLELSLEDMFAVTELPPTPPRPAKILKSVACDACGESVMESRARLFAGKTLCIPCFMEVEQKI